MMSAMPAKDVPDDGATTPSGAPLTDWEQFRSEVTWFEPRYVQAGATVVLGEGQPGRAVRSTGSRG